VYAIDHVIAVVSDLDDAAALLREHHGLASLPGGRHPGHGTGNRIVPLGDTYLELMAVVDPDEAATSPMGRWAIDNAGPGLRIAAACVRTDDIAQVAAVLDEEPLAMSRRTEDGELLSWHLAGLAGMLHSGWPFFIEWHTTDHPGRASAPHTVSPFGISTVTVPSAPPEIVILLDGVPGIDLGGASFSARIETEDGPIDV
jgi:hypothetical protein